MIIIEPVGVRERKYSDRNMKLYQVETGVLYEDAVDAVPCQYTYEETDIPIDNAEEATNEDYQSALTELGVNL